MNFYIPIWLIKSIISVIVFLIAIRTFGLGLTVLFLLVALYLMNKGKKKKNDDDNN